MGIWSRLKNPFKRVGVIPIVRLEGVISSGGRFGGGINDQNLAVLINKAFEVPRAKAVALIINSPGGSPAQSSLIAARIRRLADKKEIPVLAFCEDVAASGGYWLACAADEIFADENSIIGSIGVISAGFGFHELLSRQGIERRVYTSGEEKSMLDPFSPERKDDIKRLKIIQKAIHTNFKTYVSERRGNRIAGNDIFTGEVWESKRAKELGLIDNLGHWEPVLKERFGDTIRFKKMDKKRPFISKLGGVFFSGLNETIDNRISFSRFGL